MNLLTNDEVVAVNQDPLGKQAGQVSNKEYAQVWAKDLEDGSKAVGLFNLDDDSQEVTAKFADLKVSGKQTVRDLWRQKDLADAEDQFSATVPAHGVMLIKLHAK
jgi:alpha-galactosidase